MTKLPVESLADVVRPSRLMTGVMSACFILQGFTPEPQSGLGLDWVWLGAGGLLGALLWTTRKLARPGVILLGVVACMLGGGSILQEVWRGGEWNPWRILGILVMGSSALFHLHLYRRYSRVEANQDRGMASGGR